MPDCDLGRIASQTEIARGRKFSQLYFENKFSQFNFPGGDSQFRRGCTRRPGQLKRLVVLDRSFVGSLCCETLSCRFWVSPQ